jgi:hypothetical protein
MRNSYRTGRAFGMVFFAWGCLLATRVTAEETPSKAAATDSSAEASPAPTAAKTDMQGGEDGKTSDTGPSTPVVDEAETSAAVDPGPDSTAEKTDAAAEGEAVASTAEGEAVASTAEGDSATDNTALADDDEIIEVATPEIVEEEGIFPTAFDGENAVRRDRGINVLSARTVRKNALLFLVDHRPYLSLFNDGEDVLFDYLGLDGGNLKVGLSFRFGILDCLDVGVARLSDGRTVAFDTYEFNARYNFLKQERHQIDAALLAGVSWFMQKDRKDAAGGFAQLFIDRIFFDTLLVGVGFGFHSDSSSDEKAMDDDAFSGAVLGLIEWRVLRPLALTAEIGANVLGYGQKWPVLSFAVKVLTHRHVFSLILSNTQFILSDGIVANAWRAPSDWVFGFQITREFDF